MSCFVFVSIAIGSFLVESISSLQIRSGAPPCQLPFPFISLWEGGGGEFVSFSDLYWGISTVSYRDGVWGGVVSFLGSSVQCVVRTAPTSHSHFVVKQSFYPLIQHTVESPIVIRCMVCVYGGSGETATSCA